MGVGVGVEADARGSIEIECVVRGWRDDDEQCRDTTHQGISQLGMQ